jgi:F-type H+-transporting ATPase subunit b
MHRVRIALVGTALTGLAVLGFSGVAQAATSQDIPHANEECIKILEQASKSIDDCQEAPNPILPETNEIVWGGLAFVVLLVLMWKFGLPPVRKMMKDREDRIRGDLERAEGARVEAEQSLEQYRQQLAEARNDALRIIEEAREDADRVRRERISAVDEEIAALRARATDDVRLATERAMGDLRGQVAELSIELAEKVVERNLDRPTQEALIERYIDQVGSN